MKANSMRIALIADAFPPLRCSGAVQLRDLSLELLAQGHEPTVLIPASYLDEDWCVETWKGVRIVRLKAPPTKDIGYVRRTFSECCMPFSMLRNLRKSPVGNEKWDGVVWYSPTIFLGPVAHALKRASGCRSYLILRDIFPEWAVDVGLMGRSFPYRFFKMVEKYQYSVADVIGVQSPANKGYFSNWVLGSNRRVEVLHNWLAEAPDTGCSISIENTHLAGRKIFVYAGNMGIAQGMGVLLDLAESMQERKDLGFLFVGRGTGVQRLREGATARGLTNVAFHDEIHPSEIAGLYAQCHVGLVALDRRHKTHNVPGKFLSYMQGGLPVLASINPGNDMVRLINDRRIGRVTTEPCVAALKELALELVAEIEYDRSIQSRCRATAAEVFCPTAAVRQIVDALQAEGREAAARDPAKPTAGAPRWLSAAFGRQSPVNRL